MDLSALSTLPDSPVLEREFNLAKRRATLVCCVLLVVAVLLVIANVTSALMPRVISFLLLLFGPPSIAAILLVAHVRTRLTLARQTKLYEQWLAIPDIPQPLYWWFAHSIIEGWTQTCIRLWWPAWIIGGLPMYIVWFYEPYQWNGGLLILVFLRHLLVLPVFYLCVLTVGEITYNLLLRWNLVAVMSLNFESMGRLATPLWGESKGVGRAPATPSEIDRWETGWTAKTDSRLVKTLFIEYFTSLWPGFLFFSATGLCTAGAIQFLVLDRGGTLPVISITLGLLIACYGVMKEKPKMPE